MSGKTNEDSTPVDFREYDLWESRFKEHVLFKIGSMESYQKKEYLNSSIISAIQEGDLKKTKVLIQMGAVVNEPEPNSRTKLHIAAHYGHLEIIKFLIENGALVDVTFSERQGLGLTPLCEAASMNHLSCVQFLIQHGASVSPKTEHVCNPIYIAVVKNHVEMAALLLNHVDVNLRFNNYFFEAFEHTLLQDLWMDHDLPLLHCAILIKSREMSELLLRRGADINLKTRLLKTTLMQAVEVNQFELVKKFVYQGANVNDRDVFGQSVLHFTAINANRKASMYSKKEFDSQKQKVKIIGVLMNAGADIYARFPMDQDHSTTLHYMITYGMRLVVVQLLMRLDLDYQEINLTTIYSARFIRDNFINDDITPYIQDEENYITELLRDFKAITYFLMDWLFRRHMIRLSVNKELKNPFHRWMTVKEYEKAVKHGRRYTTGQFNRLAEIKINNVTLWQLLTCNIDELVKLMVDTRINYLESLKENKDTLCNELYRMLKMRLEFAKNSRIMFLKSTEFISKLFVNFLPYDCCRKIVDYFDVKELRAIARFVDEL